MAQTEINSFFSNAGVPAINIGTSTPGYPTIRIWEVNGAVQTLIVGEPNGTGQITDGIMLEIVGTGSPAPQDGFYTFDFTPALGYDQTRNYVIRADGGPSLPNTDRYQTAKIEPSLLDEVLAPDHLITGSLGEITSMIKADTTQLFLDVQSVEDIVSLVLQFETGRTRIDPGANTLTIYEADCVTPLRVFNLLDQSGTPSVADVCERRPVAGGSDGQPVCP